MHSRTIIACLALVIASARASAETISFDDHPSGTAPPGFTSAVTGSGGPAVWRVQKAPGSEAGNVVAQTSTERIDNRFPVLVYDKIIAADIDASVKFQAVSGSIDQAAGLVWRYRDARNYYIVRANALEDNVVLYKVQNGVRTDLPLKGKGKTYGAAAPVSKTAWNLLAVRVRGDIFAVSLNGNALYEVEDRTFQNAGKAGLWTKADSVMLFDDLKIDAVK